MIDGINSYMVKTNINEPQLKYNGLLFRENKFGCYSLKGSLHYFHNGGKHNANDMKYSDLQDVIRQLYFELNINPDITPINGFEFGVNIKLPTTPDRVLKCVIFYGNNSGQRKQGYLEFPFENYRLKIYNKSAIPKGNEFKNENILRVEIAIKRMKHLKGKVHIKQLSDLLDLHVWKQLEQILIETFEECLIIDVPKTNLDAISDKDLLKYKDFINPLYWEELRANKRRYYNKKKQCNEFINRIGGNDLKEKLIGMIRDKCRELRNVTENQKWDFLPEFQSANNPQKWDFLPIKIIQGISPTEPTKPEQPKIYCKGCGRVIENPRLGQMFCSAKVVGYENAHRCRNNATNPMHNTQRTIKRILSIPLMFDLSETIAPEKRMYL